MGAAILLLRFILFSFFLRRCTSGKSPRHLLAAESFCEEGVVRTVNVSTPEDAAQLGKQLLQCQGADFEVNWLGTVGLNQSLQLANDTSLKIVGAGTGPAVVDGGGLVRLFLVNGSSLHLEGLMLTQGYGEMGGVVAARDGSIVTFSNCDVYQNQASSGGGGLYPTVRQLLLTTAVV